MNRRDSRRPLLAALISSGVIAVWANAAPAAEMNGPMSSQRPAEAPASPAASTTAPKSTLDVEKLFANTCGWCHSNAGRTAGRGPQLMGTTLTDAEIINRIKNGKNGAMPAFGSSFSDDDIAAIVRYIRGLKPAS